jgi:hypothetical protein
MLQYSNKRLPAKMGYPKDKPAMYDPLPGGFGFVPKTIVKPLLKQTQLQGYRLQVAYNTKKDGWDARTFHRRVNEGGGIRRACQGPQRMNQGVQPVGVCVNLASTVLGLSHNWPVKAQDRAPALLSAAVNKD